MEPTKSILPSAAGKAADYRTLIGTAWSQLQTIAKSEERVDLTSSLEPAIHRFELGLFRLVVMGEIKKGKSSFVNALLGEPNLLPIASDVATSTVFKVLYGPEKRFKLFFLPDADTNRRAEPREIQASELRDYGTEDGNKGNKKRVDFIGIELPHPLLKEGLVIVDTPGVGGLFRAHRDITWRYAPNADAVCFVLDSTESVISKDEMAFLKELTQKVTRKIFFVQTKIDAADLEQWQGWDKRNREHLTKHLGIAPERLLYFPVSSKRKAVADKQQESAADEPSAKQKLLKHLERSGFPPVVKFLSQGLMKQKEKHLARLTAKQILTACDELDGQMREQLRIAQAQSKEELDKIAAELAEAEQKLPVWERETYPAELHRFSDGFSRLRLQTSGRLRGELDSAVPVGELINHLQVSMPDAQVLNQQAGEFQQNLLSRASEAVMIIEQEFNQQVIQQVEVTTARLAQGFRVSNPSMQVRPGGLVPIPVSDTLYMGFAAFEKVRYGMMGMGIGLGLASLVTVIFPPAAAIGTLLAVAAGFLGGKKGLEQLEEQKRAEAISKMQQKLTETMMRASSQAQQRFAEVSQQMEQFAQNTFAEAAKRARTDLEGRIRDVRVARARNDQDTQTKVKELQSRLRLLSATKEVLGPLIPSRTSVPK
jgi:GTPase SAR1 family protein